MPSRFAEEFPDVTSETRAAYEAPLRRIGLLNDTDRDEEVLGAFVRILTKERCSIPRALGLVLKNYRPISSSPSLSTPMTQPAPVPAPTPEVQIASPDPALLQEIEAARVAREAAEAREHTLIVELARVRHFVEGQRREVTEMRREMEAQRLSSETRIRQIDRERRHSFERIMRLEDTIRRAKPRTIWEKVRAAFSVLLGEVSAVPALPEYAKPHPDDERNELTRAA